jgi:hypothetical protein
MIRQSRLVMMLSIGVSVPMGPGDRVLVLDLADRVTDTTPTAKVRIWPVFHMFYYSLAIAGRKSSPMPTSFPCARSVLTQLSSLGCSCTWR